MKRLRAKAHYWIPLLILLGALALRAGEPPWLGGLQFAVFDEFVRTHPRIYDPEPEIPVRIVDIDEDSLAAFGQWPWSRLTLAQMVLNLRQAGAAVVAFDIVFSEPDRLSPPNAVREWSMLEGAENLLGQVAGLPDFDQAFAQYLDALNPVVLGFVLSQDDRLPRLPRFRGTFATKGLASGDVRRFLQPVYTGAVTNLPIFEDAASGNGNISMRQERDGLVRRVPMIFQLDTADGDETRLYPSLVAEAFRTVQDVKTMVVRANRTDITASLLDQATIHGLSDVQIGAKTIPVDEYGHLWLHSTGHQMDRYLSAGSILTGDFDPQRVAGAIIFIGSTAAGLLDLRTTPLASQYPGVEIHAEIAEQIIADHFLQRPGSAFFYELLFILVLGLVLIGAMPILGAVKSAVLGGMCILAAFGFSWMRFTQDLQLFDPVFPAIAALAIYLSGTLILFMREESQRRQIRGAFSH